MVGKSRAAIGNKIRRCEIGAASRATRDRAADCDGNLGIDLTDLLNEAVTSVVSPSASQVKLLQRLDSLRQRIAANRFHLALLGQFKRGKSTLLNALLGADVLPTGVIPVTAIPIFLQAASTPSLRVTFTGGRIEEYEADTPSAFRERLTAFVTEEANPRNMLGVARVELRLPSELLASGVVLIDTPGVGSTFHHNTAAANAVLAECDAAFFVVSPDPPITEVEVQFLASVRQTVARIIVVLNKIDTVEPDERIIVEAFLRRVLAEQAGLDMTTPIFCLSGRDALRARLVGDCGAPGGERNRGTRSVSHTISRFGEANDTPRGGCPQGFGTDWRPTNGNQFSPQSVEHAADRPRTENGIVRRRGEQVRG